MPSPEISESVLLSTKKLLGIPSDDNSFDVDLIIHINSAFVILHQLGVGPKSPFKITGENELWSDFIQDNAEVENTKTYIYMKVKKIFDPPQSSAVMNALNESIAEFEWRLNVAVDPKKGEIP